MKMVGAMEVEISFFSDVLPVQCCHDLAAELMEVKVN
jgi:hypothetical protein